MSKAEELAEKAYPEGGIYIFGDASIACQVAYVKGYRQAKKDNELTWEDIERIFDIHTEIKCEDSISLYSIEFYQEVLKLFKAQKGEYL